MATQVTDPALLAQLNAPEPKGRVTDPALLAKLNADPIHIGAPDGSIVEFPADTSDDTIKSVMAKHYPPPAAVEPQSTLQTVREAIHAPTRLLKDWTDLPQVAKDAGRGAGFGLLVGGAIPAAGAAIGAGYRGVSNAFGSTSALIYRTDKSPIASTTSHLTMTKEAAAPAVLAFSIVV